MARHPFDFRSRSHFRRIQVHPTLSQDSESERQEHTVQMHISQTTRGLHVQIQERVIPVDHQIAICVAVDTNDTVFVITRAGNGDIYIYHTGTMCAISVLGRTIDQFHSFDASVGMNLCITVTKNDIVEHFRYYIKNDSLYRLIQTCDERVFKHIM